MAVVTRVLGYRLLKKLGRGGMADVYLALDEAAERQVALKLMKPAAASAPGSIAARNRREAAILSELSHPNIVKILDHGVADGRGDFIVMEYIAGPTLRAQLAAAKPLSVERGGAILRAIGEALSYLHERGIIHRDLKPENVLLDRDGVVKVSDFGVAVAVREIGRLTQPGIVMGSLDYMAPEQRHRLPVDAAVDQFSFGVIAYEMLTGRRPLGNFKAPSQLNRRLSRGVDEVILRALEEDPEDRFPTVSAFSNALQEALQHKRNGSRLLRTAALLVPISVVGLMFGWWAWDGGRWPAGGWPSADNQAAADDSPGPPGGSDGDAARPGEPTPTRFAQHLAAAEAYRDRGQLDKAMEHYDEAVQLDPENAKLLEDRAFVHWRLYNHDAAITDLMEAIRLAPHRAGPRTRCGLIYVQRREIDKALEILGEEIRLHPEEASAYAYRGRAYALKKDLGTAIKDLDRAIELNVDCGEAYHFRALLKNQQRHYEEALSDFQQSLRCTPDNPFAYTLLSLMLSRCPDPGVRDPREALCKAIRACEMTNYQHYEPLEALAAAHFALQDIEQAIHWCKSAHQLAPTAARARLERQLARYRGG